MKNTTLSKWLDSERGRKSALAVHLGVVRGFVTQMATGYRPIPERLVEKIHAFTGGEVIISYLMCRPKTRAAKSRRKS